MMECWSRWSRWGPVFLAATDATPQELSQGFGQTRKKREGTHHHIHDRRIKPAGSQLLHSSIPPFVISSSHPDARGRRNTT
jgi:hypothetical protein